MVRLNPLKLSFAIALMAIFPAAQAWSVPANQKPLRSRRKQIARAPERSSAFLTTHKMLKHPFINQRTKNVPERSSRTQLSNSVLASCDTLPSFRTAHGLLSPLTVSRLQEISKAEEGNMALGRFLDTYNQEGPLSCVPLLSDPEVLPHLTLAMRDIAK